MPTYSYKRPIKILMVDSSKYVNEHMTHFFDVYTQKRLMDSPIELRERFFEMTTKHHPLLIKLLGESITRSQLWLPRLIEEGIETPLVQDFKKWLEKQEKQ